MSTRPLADVLGVNRRDRTTLRLVTGRPLEREEHELSTASLMLQTIREKSDQQEGKVERLKSAIDARCYENSLKLSVALDRLMAKVEPA